MQTRWRKYVVLLAIGAIAANCVGSQGAAAAHHPITTAIEQAVDHGSHDHAAATHEHHDSAGNGNGTGHTDKQGGIDDSSKVCCTSMNCAGIAILTPGDVAPIRANKNPVAIVFDDAVQTLALGIIDPPPRSI